MPDIVRTQKYQCQRAVDEIHSSQRQWIRDSLEAVAKKRLLSNKLPTDDVALLHIAQLPTRTATVQ